MVREARIGAERTSSPFWLLMLLFLATSGLLLGSGRAAEVEIPLPEHPRPDFERAEWSNLNGDWGFCFDAENVGLEDQWFRDANSFSKRIVVPFSWGAPLSGVADQADVAWYARTVEIPEDWAGKRVFLVIGASDWETRAWLDGRQIGAHRGGYTPFEFELTSQVVYGSRYLLVLRVDDSPHKFKLEGKQGYGPARGIWQTPYLEARGSVPCETVHFTPDLANDRVKVQATLLEPAPQDMMLRIDLAPSRDSAASRTVKIPRGEKETSFEISIPNPRLWDLEDPFLYQAVVSLTGDNLVEDRVLSYFGMREISVAPLPGHEHPYIALNGEPIYLQMALDQAYHPDGYYTFPSDQFMKDEILRTLRLGLNGIRIHVKIGIPRKLYWADRLGLLVMADVPNSWGEPDPDMRAEAELALKGMIKRDYNHPSIFSWVLFNETWGLRFEKSGYDKEVQQWVASLYDLTKRIDPTRLVEDNSANRGDHVATDINSWHVYLSGQGWRDHLEEVSSNTFPGSNWNFVEDKTQGNQPLLNSECGNVWGYEGSTGDVDWSWDYHIMLNEFRKHPKISGWLYTEHHDVINEWNGYFRFDRSPKFTGLSEFVDGMSIRDLHSPVFVSTGSELCQEVGTGSPVEVPLWLSVMGQRTEYDHELTLRASLWGWDQLGQRRSFSESRRQISARSWMSEELDPLVLRMPEEPSLSVLSLRIEDSLGYPLHRNFVTFLVSEGDSPQDQMRVINEETVRLLRFAPNAFSDSFWSQKQWEVLEGLKVNGAGYGFFEYRVRWPKSLSLEDIKDAVFIVELSSKELFAKDRAEKGALEGNYMRGGGVNDRSLNPNSYPMTDDQRFPSTVRVRMNGEVIGVANLKDDPADHRGVLSWHSQLGDRRLREAGSYGYLTRCAITRRALERAHAAGELVVRLEVDSPSSGGIAVYGKRFGRYPFDPTLAFVLDR